MVEGALMTSGSGRIALILAFGPLLTLTATGRGDERPVDFTTEIIPLLTKGGCNSGACHGAAVGRGGFKLSLYGGKPSADYTAIVHQLEGRRINLAAPEQSLLLRKPTQWAAHGGGERFAADSAAGKLLARWISAGAPRGGARKLVEFELTPRSALVEGPGARVSLQAMATFSDGTRRDVTDWTVFTPEDPSAIDIDKYEQTSTAVVRRRGEHILRARFLDRIVPVRILVPLSDQPVDHSQQPRNNFIDELVLDKLETLHLPVSAGLDDSGYLRRVTLDLTGRLPTPEDVDAFLADRRADKRERLVDRLLQSEAFVDYWTFQFAKLLRIRSQPKDRQGALTYHRWLRRQIAAGTPLDEMARSLLTATGDSHSFGPANFYRTTSDARSQAEFVSELFMGVRLRCANCHNHPLDRWTQDDYHGLAAVFAKVNGGRVITVGTRGEVTHPATGRPAKPRIPGERFLEPHGRSNDGRHIFAEWLTDKRNPYFAEAMVNRLWKALMGRGLIEPVDDARATNPPTHPRLLDWLAADFERNGYDLRHTLRLIATSRTYARSSLPVNGRSGKLSNEADDRYYSRALARKLPPEVLLDAVCSVTGVAETFGNQPTGTTAVQLFDPRIPSPTLDILGRCNRRGSCESGGDSGGGLAAKLHWINGEFLNRKITAPQGRLHKLIADGMSDVEIIEEFYRRALSRDPTKTERRFWTRQLAEAESPRRRRELLEDFVWSLLSCREFRTR